MSTWARIEARSYADALGLLEDLTELPDTFSDEELTIYVAADAPAVPELIHGDEPLARDADASRL